MMCSRRLVKVGFRLATCSGGSGCTLIVLNQVWAICVFPDRASRWAIRWCATEPLGWVTLYEQTYPHSVKTNMARQILLFRSFSQIQPGKELLEVADILPLPQVEVVPIEASG